MKKKQYLNESINHQFSSINYSNYQFLSNPGHGGKKRTRQNARNEIEKKRDKEE